jgi:hypothetical protein
MRHLARGLEESLTPGARRSDCHLNKHRLINSLGMKVSERSEDVCPGQCPSTLLNPQNFASTSPYYRKAKSAAIVFPCGNGLVETVPWRSFMVCTISAHPPIVISYLIDRRCFSSITLLALAPACLRDLSVLGGTERGERACPNPVPIVISLIYPYCAWC